MFNLKPLLTEYNIIYLFVHFLLQFVFIHFIFIKNYILMYLIFKANGFDHVFLEFKNIIIY